MKRVNGTVQKGSQPIGCFLLVKEPSRIELIMKFVELLFKERDILCVEFHGTVYPDEKKSVLALCRNRLAAFFHFYKMKLERQQYLENQGLLYKYFSHDTRISAEGLLYGDFFRSRKKSRVYYYSPEEQELFRKVLSKLQDQGVAGEFVEQKGM